MKLPFLLLLLGLSARSIAQQLPNGDLETWLPEAGNERARSWLSTDDALGRVVNRAVLTGTTTKTTDRFNGRFAAKLETKALWSRGTFPGSLALGSPVENSCDRTKGLPFAGRPTALQLHYKLSGPNLAADSAVASVLLTRIVDGQRHVVAKGLLVLVAAENYSLAKVPLVYRSDLAPDSVQVFISTGIVRNPTAGTTLYVDNLVMTPARLGGARVGTQRLSTPAASGVAAPAFPQKPALPPPNSGTSSQTGRVTGALKAAAFLRN